MAEPKAVKAFTFDEMVDEAAKKHAALVEKHNLSGGMCVKCEEHLSQFSETGESSAFMYHCTNCAGRIKALVEEASGPGFMAFHLMGGKQHGG